MTKFIIYTSNLPFAPKTLDDVISFAKKERKFMISPAELNPYLQKVESGDNIITKRGNNIYVIRAIQTDLESASTEDKNYIETLFADYGMRKVNITSVHRRIPYATWNPSVAVFGNNNKTTSTKFNNMNGKSIIERIKANFMPTEAQDVRLATDGNICVATAQGYVAINANNELLAYPEELTLKLPVFVISKPADQLQAGDVIALAKSYAKVVSVREGKITAISYTGSGKTIHTIKDVLFNQTMVRVVVSLASNLGGNINPLMLMMMQGESSKEALLPLMMMSQNQGNVGMNPMMLMMLAGDGESSSIKDMLMFSAMSGQNIFGNMGNMFATPANTTMLDQATAGIEAANTSEN